MATVLSLSGREIQIIIDSVLATQLGSGSDSSMQWEILQLLSKLKSVISGIRLGQETTFHIADSNICQISVSLIILMISLV